MSNRLVLNRDAIKRASDIKTEFVPTPEWADGNPDARIFVRSLTGRERAEWQSATVTQTKRGTSVDFHESTVGVIVLGACDEYGTAIFGDADKQWLLDKSSGCLERVSEAIMRLSGIGDEDVEALKKGIEEGTYRRFLFSLAGHLKRTVAELLDDISSSELTEWELIDAMEPIGERGAYKRAGTIAAMIANVNRAETTTPYTEGDIFPWLKGEDAELDPEEIAERLEMIFPMAKKA